MEKYKNAPAYQRYRASRTRTIAAAQRRYSPLHLSMLFFAFCGIGWGWEVLLDLLQKGQLVNRGVLYGPWLPIYGVAGILLLLLIKPWLDKPPLALFVTFVATGILEYSASWLIEAVTGRRWWDYSGYFMSIDGRVCFTALLFFCLAGMAGVYWLAPRLDDWLAQRSVTAKRVLAAGLLLAFLADLVFAYLHPNLSAVI